MMYQFFKDFAGPIGTIVAAITAVIVTAYFACQQTRPFSNAAARFADYPSLVT
jgi:hypothetical protein